MKTRSKAKSSLGSSSTSNNTCALTTPELVALLVKNHCLFCLEKKKTGILYTINAASREATDGYELLRRYFGIKTSESLNDIFDAAVVTNQVLLTAEFPAPLLCSNCVKKLKELDVLHYKLEAIQQEILYYIRSIRKSIINNSSKKSTSPSCKGSSKTSSSKEGLEQQMSKNRKQFERDILKRCCNDIGTSKAATKILDDFYESLVEETQDSISVPLEHLDQISTYSPSPSTDSDDDDIEESYDEPVSPVSCTRDNFSDAALSEDDIDPVTYTIRIKNIKVEEYDEDVPEASTVGYDNIDDDDSQTISQKDVLVTIIKSESKADECATPERLEARIPSNSNADDLSLVVTPSIPSSKEGIEGMQSNATQQSLDGKKSTPATSVKPTLEIPQENHASTPLSSQTLTTVPSSKVVVLQNQAPTTSSSPASLTAQESQPPPTATPCDSQNQAPTSASPASITAQESQPPPTASSVPQTQSVSPASPSELAPPSQQVTPSQSSKTCPQRIQPSFKPLPLIPALVNLNILKGSKPVQVQIQRTDFSINIYKEKIGNNKLPGENNSQAININPLKPNLKRKISGSDGNKLECSSAVSPAKSVALNVSSPSKKDGTTDSGSSGTVTDQSNSNNDTVSKEFNMETNICDTNGSANTTQVSSNKSANDEDGGSGFASDSSSDSESDSSSGTSNSGSSSSEDSSSDDEEAIKTKTQKSTRIPRPRDKGFIGPRNAPSYMWPRIKGLPKPYKCSECDFECCNITRYRIHMLKFHGIEVKPKVMRRTYICDICGYSKEGERTQNFLSHLLTHETHVKSRNCPDCLKQFTTKQFYQLHICLRTGLTKDEPTPSDLDRKSDLTCRFCTLVCRSVRQLVSHTENDHPGNDPFICSICSQGFKERERVVTHKILKHDATKLKCRICEPAEEFVNSHELFTHLNMKHHGLAQKCSYCPKLFIDMSRLRDHEVMHSGEKNYICSVCGNTYSTNGTLQTHMKAVHSETPVAKFDCEYCHKAYTQRSYLKKHIKNKHGVDVKVTDIARRVKKVTN